MNSLRAGTLMHGTLVRQPGYAVARLSVQGFSTTNHDRRLSARGFDRPPDEALDVWPCCGLVDVRIDAGSAVLPLTRDRDPRGRLLHVRCRRRCAHLLGLRHGLRHGLARGGCRRREGRGLAGLAALYPARYRCGWAASDSNMNTQFDADFLCLFYQLVQPLDIVVDFVALLGGQEEIDALRAVRLLRLEHALQDREGE